MCRLLYLPRDVARDKLILRPWLEDLERSNGGHGNGFATVRWGATKGVLLSAADCARKIARFRAPVIWHTRLTSCGKTIDDLCHPFQTKRGWLAHNGHWQQGVFGAKLLQGDWSDSKVGALWIRLYGWESFTKRCDSGVWLHLTKKGCQVHYASGSLYVETETGALCSQPCSEWGTWLEAKKGTYDAGEEVPVDSYTRMPSTHNGPWVTREDRNSLYHLLNR